MNILSLKSVTKKFSANTVAIRNIDLQLPQGELLALTGESGCGKTTLLRLIAGLESPDQGTIEIDNSLVAGPHTMVPPQQRPVGLVFQDYALFPHMTVLQNVLFGLKSSPIKQAKERSMEVLDLVNLPGLEKRYPHELSGGQQQRVAIARSLAPKPKLLLLDEPFSNLDTLLRDQVRQELLTILRKAGTTVILVTHDVQDALSMADSIAVLRNGCLLQVGSPGALYDEPVDGYTATFFGKANLIPITSNLGQSMEQAGAFHSSDIASKKGFFCLRPQHLSIAGQDANSVQAEVISVNFMGDHQRIKLKTPECDLWCFAPISKRLDPGQQVGLNFDLEKIHIIIDV